jgi:hypothetical protein
MAQTIASYFGEENKKTKDIATRVCLQNSGDAAMIMRRVGSLLLCILLLSTSSWSGDQVSIAEFVHFSGRWENPPLELLKTYQYDSNAQIVRFHPDGKFFRAHVTLFRDNKTGRVTISNGDDVAVYQARWKKASPHHVKVFNIRPCTNITTKNGTKDDEVWDVQFTKTGVPIKVGFASSGFVPAQEVKNLSVFSNLLRSCQ